MIKNKILSGMMLSAVLMLAACSDVKQDLGVGRNSPDEFAVLKRAPLTLPPEYTLRPPTDASEAPPAAAAATQAKAQLLGRDETPAVAGAGEKAMLDKLGVASAKPDIRKQIDEDNGYLSFKNQSMANKLISWDDEPSADNIPSSTVDATKEAARIKQTQAEGKPINTGNVPVIEKKQSTLDKIF